MCLFCRLGGRLEAPRKCSGTASEIAYTVQHHIATCPATPALSVIDMSRVGAAELSAGIKGLGHKDYTEHAGSRRNKPFPAHCCTAYAVPSFLAAEAGPAQGLGSETAIS